MPLTKDTNFVEQEAKKAALLFLQHSCFIDLNGLHNARLLHLIHTSNYFFDLFHNTYHKTVLENRTKFSENRK